MGCTGGKLKELDGGTEESVRFRGDQSISPLCVLRMDVPEDQNCIKSAPNEVHSTNSTTKLVHESKPVDVYSIKLDENVTAKYRFIRVIGTGRYSHACLVQHRSTKAAYAMKISSGEEGKLIFNTELKILTRTRHENIVRLVETFERAGDRFYMALELAGGGDLFDRTASQPGGHFTEGDAATITLMIADGLKYLHRLCITHRDLKLDNLLFEHPGPDSKILITDFSVAHMGRPSHRMTTACGTPEYLAPEILRRQPYTCTVDLWSLGVVVYYMLCGSFPFTVEDENDPGNVNKLYQSIVRGQYSLDGQIWKGASKDSKGFVRGLLSYPPETRLTAAQARGHRWIARYDSDCDSDSSLESSLEMSFEEDQTIDDMKQRLKCGKNRDPEINKLRTQILEFQHTRYVVV